MAKTKYKTVSVKEQIKRLKATIEDMEKAGNVYKNVLVDYRQQLVRLEERK